MGDREKTWSEPSDTSHYGDRRRKVRWKSQARSSAESLAGATDPSFSERRINNSSVFDLEPGGRLSAKLLPSPEEDMSMSRSSPASGAEWIPPKSTTEPGRR